MSKFIFRKELANEKNHYKKRLEHKRQAASARGGLWDVCQYLPSGRTLSSFPVTNKKQAENLLLSEQFHIFADGRQKDDGIG